MIDKNSVGEDEVLRAQLADARRQIVALNTLITRLGSDVRASGPKEVAEARRQADEAMRRAEEAERRAAEAERVRAELQAKLDMVLASRSWRLTRGLRVAGRLFRGDFAPLAEALRARSRRG
jgi:hypothetical protein